jgi:HD-GYP domain-containing protein (c-di-GMP phosphodiesterase class II)
MSLERSHARQVFIQYVSVYDTADPKIKLKIAHTFRVASLADTIAHSLALSPDDCDFAWVSGLLHDIGRFERKRQILRLP